MNKRENSLIKDLGLIIFSIIIAVIFVKTGIFKSLLTRTQELEIIGSFIAGIFFTSIFTTAPATVVLAEIAQSGSIFVVAFFGGLGALIGDFIIFGFIKCHLAEDISYLVKKSGWQRLKSIFHLRIFKWLIPFIGALIVASPLPDELGLAMMGLYRMKTSFFIPLSFFLNSLGILIIGLIARAL